ncbi:MAG: SLBB domain-containing protein, partial [Candidatus Kapaibacterium sp.]
MINRLCRFYRATGAVAVLLGLLLAVTIASGQPSGGGATTTSGSGVAGNASGSFYDYSRSGEIPINVNIWGFVRAPGKYRVSSSTTLIELISLAGGPVERAKLTEVRIVHNINVDSSLASRPVAIFNVDEFKQSGNPKENGVLYPDDTVIIP